MLRGNFWTRRSIEVAFTTLVARGRGADGGVDELDLEEPPKHISLNFELGSPRYPSAAGFD